MLVFQERIFASHYQFYIFDKGYEHSENLNWESSPKLDFDYLGDSKSIYVKTLSDLNDHRLRIYNNDKPINKKYERIFKHSIKCSTGSLIISTPIDTDEDDIKIDLKPGTYTIYVCSSSLGKDFFSYDKKYNEDMSDNEYMSYDIFEYYDLYITT